MRRVQHLRLGTLAVLGVLQVALSPSAQAVAGSWQVGRLAGRAWIDGADGERNTLTLGTLVQPGVTIYTADRSSLTLLRGAESMAIGPRSIVAISEHPTQGLTTTVLERAGTVEFDVDHRNVQHFSVETPMLAAVVKGTRFKVSVSRKDGGVSVSRGTVEVTSLRSGQTTNVTIGQHAHVGNGGAMSVGGAGRAAPMTQGLPRTPVVKPVATFAPMTGLASDFSAAELAAVATVAAPQAAIAEATPVTSLAVATVASPAAASVAASTATSPAAAGTATPSSAPATSAASDPARTSGSASALQALANAIASALAPGRVSGKGNVGTSVPSPPGAIGGHKPGHHGWHDFDPGKWGPTPGSGGKDGHEGSGKDSTPGADGSGKPGTPTGSGKNETDHGHHHGTPRGWGSGWGSTGSGESGHAPTGFFGRFSAALQNAAAGPNGPVGSGAPVRAEPATVATAPGRTGPQSGSSQTGSAGSGRGTTSGSSAGGTSSAAAASSGGTGGGNRGFGGGNGWSAGFRGRGG